MTTHKGKEGGVSIGGTAIGELKSFELTVTANEVDTSTMGADWTGVDSTQNSWKGSMDMFWDEGDAGQTLLVVGTKVAVSFFPEGETSGLVEKSGTALITSVSDPQSHDGMVERTVEFTGDGALLSGVVV